MVPASHPLSMLQEKGYAVIKNLLSYDTTNHLREEIEAKIVLCAQEISCAPQDYLSAVSRWVAPSAVTAAVSSSLLNMISQKISKLAEKPIHLRKMNVICKNAFCVEPIAYHQDISYSPDEPYEFSTWIALNDVSEAASPLEVIPGTHLLPLKPAVDFWSPDYEPNSSLSHRALKLTVESGDAVFFDSRLWHGSGENQSLSSRYALVLRWISEGWKLEQPIPPIEPGFFGLWTSGKMTEALLSEGLKTLFHRSALNFLDLIETWETLVQESSLPFACDVDSALKSLKRLKILHLAYTHHGGGDATGTVYKTLWQSFLCPLQQYISDLQPKVNERKIG